MIDTHDSIVFVRRCGNCGYVLINEDQIRNGERLIEAHSGYQSSLEGQPVSDKMSSRSPYFVLSVPRCPKCHSELSKIVIPLKHYHDEQ